MFTIVENEEIEKQNAEIRKGNALRQVDKISEIKHAPIIILFGTIISGYGDLIIACWVVVKG